MVDDTPAAATSTTTTTASSSDTTTKCVVEETGGKGGLTFCEDFRKQATPPEELDSLCFDDLKSSSAATTPIVGHPAEGSGTITGSGGSVAEVSCASSTCSLGGNHSDTGHTVVSSNVVEQRGIISEQINAKLIKRTTSRHGRSSQRWVSDPASHAAIRLTTGCVPICKDGNVLFVSASSKPVWIFPKGGWESDEKMEESALREAYEEAGVIGILGPKLTEVQYETRKAKKRRLEAQEKMEHAKAAKEESKEKRAPNDSSATAAATTSPVPKDTTSTPEVVQVSREALAKMRGDVKAPKLMDDASSTTSDSNYNQVRMILFPLYVTTIKREWPEGGRLRRAVPIDEALQILEARPELQAALIEVKKRGLHLLGPDNRAAAAPQDATKPDSLPVI